MGPKALLISAICALMLVVSAQEYPLGGGGGGARSGKSAATHLRSLLREPMPWEDSYFDPSYHAWPKSSNGKQSASEKGSLRALVSQQQVNGGAGLSKRASAGAASGGGSGGSGGSGSSSNSNNNKP